MLKIKNICEGNEKPKMKKLNPQMKKVKFHKLRK